MAATFLVAHPGYALGRSVLCAPLQLLLREINLEAKS
jgi:hypothetical protein